MQDYPLPKFHFQVEWGGSRLGFTEVSGLEVETEMIEYRDGASPEYNKRRIPGLRKYANITLKRGTFANDNEFYDWWKKTALFENLDDQRRDLTISLLNEAHEAVIVWTVKQAWPVKMTSTDLKADANEVAIETLELAHEGLEVKAA
jgi:phage tail-like protein